MYLLPVDPIAPKMSMSSAETMAAIANEAPSKVFLFTKPQFLRFSAPNFSARVCT